MTARKKGATRKKATKRGKAGRKRGMPASGRKTATPRPSKAEYATAKPIDLGEHMKSLAAAHMLESAPKGACLVTDPGTGSARCTRATRDFCKNVLKGTFIGGPCGG
jgi:hypothetical protein